MNRERLLNVAKALRESPNPDHFTMDTFHFCGAPACALGHYAARRDLQDTFELRERWGIQLIGVRTDTTVRLDGPEVCEHFDICPEIADCLFRETHYDDEDRYLPCGCGGAQTPIEAAEYIERLVAEASP